MAEPERDSASETEPNDPASEEASTREERAEGSTATADSATTTADSATTTTTTTATTTATDATEPESEPVRAAARASVGGDEESPASVHVTFVILTFAGACLLLPPRQWVSSAMLFVLSIALGIRWRRDVGHWLTRRDGDEPAPKT